MSQAVWCLTSRWSQCSRIPESPCNHHAGETTLSYEVVPKEPQPQDRWVSSSHDSNPRPARCLSRPAVPVQALPRLQMHG